MLKVLVLSIVVGCIAAQQRGVDLTLAPGAGGSDVVRAVLSKIDTSLTFPADNRLMRRIAFAQTRDGLANDTYSRPDFHGGIWGVSEEQFNQTRTTNPEFYANIEASFGIDWLNQVVWKDLRKPFFSGLAARLFLTTISDPIPLSSEFLEQASYYVRNYDPTASEFGFLDDVTELVFTENDECSVYSDIMFVLDSSGSIGQNDYDEVLNYVHRFSDSLDISPDENQVGVIIFSENPEIEFGLDTFGNKSGVLNAIEQIPYLTKGTNTGDALRLMINESFTVEAGARLDDDSIFRLAIVMTDGASNRGEPVEVAAAAVHAFRPAILVYVIAVGDVDSDRQEELEQIATAPEFIDHLNSFDPDLLTAAQLDRSYEICFTASVPEDIGQPVSGILDQGQQVRYQFPIPVQGVTVRLCVRSGQIVFYASTVIPNPSNVLHEHRRQCVDCDCDLFVGPPDITGVVSEETVARRRRAAAGNGTSEGDIIEYSNTTLYISMEGVQERSSFELQTDVGDTTESDDSDSNFATVLGVSVAVVAAVLLLVLVTTVIVLAVVVSRKKDKSVVSA